MKKFSMLAAGRGSNFEAIMQRVASGELDAQCISLITYAPHCKAIDVAKKYGVPTRLVEDSNILSILQNENPNLIAMSGYMRKIPDSVIEHFENRILNIHPSLLPSFGGKGCYGMRVHEKVIEAGVKVTGVTVHLVNKVYDSGRIIAQSPVPVFPDDTLETLAKRVLREEHDIYWQAIKNFKL
jgi:phosphoribosylglycinamide formyltransferase-1